MSNVSDHEWARLLYRLEVDNIENAKRRQWSITNYTLLIFAAIFTLARLLNDPATQLPIPLPLKWLCLIVTFLVSIFAIYHLIDTHTAMVHYRIRAEAINKNYTILHTFDPPEENYTRFSRYFWSVTMLFIYLIILGMAFVVIYLSYFISSYCADSVLTLLIMFLSIDAIATSIFALVYKKKADLFREKHIASCKEATVSDIAS